MDKRIYFLVNKINLARAFISKKYKLVNDYLKGTDPRILILVPITVLILSFLLVIPVQRILRKGDYVYEIPIPEKSTYINKDRYTVYFTEIEVPTHPDGVTGIEVIYADIALETNTRYLRYYIEKNKTALIDVISSSLYSSAAPFILTMEGKDLLIDKIIRELNDYIARYGPEGKIVKGHIVNLLGGPRTQI